jgi:cell division protein FtsB
MLLGLQYRLWFGAAGVAPLQRLQAEQAVLRAAIAEKRKRNEALKEDIRNLKHRLEALEELAREELGLIKDGEHFFRLVRPVDSHASKPK